MAATTIQLSGFRELGEAMRLLSSEVSNKAARAATAAAAGVVKKAARGRVIANDSKNGTSVDTGSLRDAIIVKKLSKAESQLTSEHIVTVRGRGKPYNKKGRKIDRAPHAHLVEFGTVNMAAEPFLRPAIDNSVRPAIEAMADKLRKAIAKAGK